MALNSLSALFLHELRDLYSAETQLLEALPLMARAASHDKLKSAFNDHLDETREQLSRLDRIFEQIGESSQGERCEALAGLLKEAQGTINAQGDPNVKDAALISAAQRIEHYEMAGYGAARNYAKLLELSDPASLLDDTLDEEESADKKLTKLATGGWLSKGINKEARA